MSTTVVVFRTEPILVFGAEAPIGPWEDDSLALEGTHELDKVLKGRWEATTVIIGWRP